MTREEYIQISRMYNEVEKLENYLKISSSPKKIIFINTSNGLPYEDINFKSERFDFTGELREKVDLAIKKYLSETKEKLEKMNITMESDEIMAISKPKTEKEEWQMIWRYCKLVMKYTIEGPLCPHDLGLSDRKELEGECGNCQQCWHDAIWGGDK